MKTDGLTFLECKSFTLAFVPTQGLTVITPPKIPVLEGLKNPIIYSFQNLTKIWRKQKTSDLKTTGE